MSDIYQAPQADLIDEAAIQPFYIVSRKKFLILFLGTAALYGVYWFYRHWKAYRLATGTNILPVLRAIFSYFFIISLFKRMREHGEKQGLGLDWSPVSQGAALVVILILSGIVGFWPSIYGVAIMLLLLLPQTLIMVTAQDYANAACGDRAGQGNNALTGANLLWLVIGVLSWLLTFAGFLLPEA